MTASRRALALGAGLGALAGLAVLTGAVRSRRTRRIDRQVRRWMQAHRSRLGDGVFNAVTFAGIPPVHLPAALIAAAAVDRKRGVAPALPLVLASLAAFGSHHAIKGMVPSRRRPGASWPDRERPAFPSGHTTGATAVAATIGYMLLRERLAPAQRVLPLAMGLPAAVGFSRAYLDRHWAADVLAGWLLGGGIAGLAIALYEESRHVTENRGESHRTAVTGVSEARSRHPMGSTRPAASARPPAAPDPRP